MKTIKNALVDILHVPKEAANYKAEINQAIDESNYKSVIVLTTILFVFTASLGFYYHYYQDNNVLSNRYSFYLFMGALFLSLAYLIFLRTIVKKMFDTKKYKIINLVLFVMTIVFFVWASFVSLVDQLTINDITAFVTFSCVIAGALSFPLAHTIVLYSIPTALMFIGLPIVQKHMGVLYNHYISVVVSVLVSILISRLVYHSKIREILNKIELEKTNKQLEQQITIMNKLAFLGESLSEIIHNLRNPITLSKGYGELIKAAMPNSELPNKLIESINKIEAIVRTILKSSQTTMILDYQDADINQIIKNEIQLLLATGYEKHKVSIIYNFSDLPPYRCVVSQIGQCFSNIIKNAFDAMFSASNRVLKITTSVDEKNNICITIFDTGTGIKEEDINKIFEPFFTTKNTMIEKEGTEPTGTGLGLPYTKKIIEQYNGHIGVQSEIGKGTTFILTLAKI